MQNWSRPSKHISSLNKFVVFCSNSIELVETPRLSFRLWKISSTIYYGWLMLISECFRLLSVRFSHKPNDCYLQRILCLIFLVAILFMMSVSFFHAVHVFLSWRDPTLWLVCMGRRGAVCYTGWLVRIFAVALGHRQGHGILKDRPNGPENWLFCIENIDLMFEEFFYSSKFCSIMIFWEIRWLLSLLDPFGLFDDSFGIHKAKQLNTKFWTI